MAGKKKTQSLKEMQRITISGLPGSGTTTVSLCLSKALGVPVFSAGKIFREEATKLKMSLNTFSKYCEKNSEVDRKLDDIQIDILKNGEFILESRLGGWLSFKKGIPVFKVWLDATNGKRIKRVAGRDNFEYEQTKRCIKQREKSETIRYKKFYGIDIEDL